MKTRVVGLLFLLAALLLAGCNAPIPRHIDVCQIDPDSPQQFSLRTPTGRATVITQFFPDDKDSISLKRTDGTTLTIPNPICVTTKVSAAIVPLYPDMDVLLLVQHDQGTGYDSDELRILNPREGEFVMLSVTNFSDESTPLSRIEVSDNFHDNRFARERELLERIKDDYGYQSEHMLIGHETDIQYAAYFWRQHNANVTDGILKWQHYPGKHPDNGSVPSVIKDGDVTYTSYFKGGVWAYDQKRDESVLVFFPNDMYGWADKLLLWKHQLLVCPSGEDLALIDMRTGRMRRVKSPLYSNAIQKFSVTVTEDALILNDNTVLKFESQDK
ncbi:MAG: hypothetical protein FWD61_16890 [Phycisphaerales bacterium]|nr:hypothetical protein [Phycisphaerales bacterium]